MRIYIRLGSPAHRGSVKGVSCFCNRYFTHTAARCDLAPQNCRNQVVNTSSEPALCRSLAQLRSRLGSCWLSSAQAATVASLVPRVLGGAFSACSAFDFIFGAFTFLFQMACLASISKLPGCRIVHKRHSFLSARFTVDRKSPPGGRRGVPL